MNTDPARPLAWHNDPAVKADAVARMRRHAAADEFLLDSGYAVPDPDVPSGYRGCFHGCLTLEILAGRVGITPAEYAAAARTVSWWSAAEQLFGIPHGLAEFLDAAYEWSTSVGEAAGFAVAATEAIPVGADLWAINVEQLGVATDDGTVAEAQQVILDALRNCPVPAGADRG